MTAIQTQGSRYLVDEENKTITGGKLGTTKVTYLGWNIDVLNRACFVINDQQTLLTSPIVNMWECGTIKPRKETLMNKIVNILSR
jgi:hypothetical protein